jgi:hypothetical protein
MRFAPCNGLVRPLGLLLLTDRRKRCRHVMAAFEWMDSSGLGMGIRHEIRPREFDPRDVRCVPGVERQDHRRVDVTCGNAARLRRLSS